MAIYSYSNSILTKVDTTSFTNEKILERKHLQSALKRNIYIIAPNCLVIAEEFSEWTDSLRRIDLLAIDKEAKVVVIELKRTETGEHMELQAIRYAAMVSTLTFSRAVTIYQNYLKINGLATNAEEEILNFLQWDEPQEDDFALDVRMILVSSDFSKELTTSVMWLNERDIDIRCVRLIPYKKENEILIDVQQIIPLPEAENYQVKIRQQTEERREARNNQKDYTQYLFKNNLYNKRKLVLAVISSWIAENNPQSFSELIRAFPQEIHSGGLFLKYSEAGEMYKRQGIARHFLDDNEIIKFSNEECYAISNQWGKGNIEKFVIKSRALGLEIEEKES